ncbi:nodulation protein NodH [Phaeovulum sp.]|uniref:nodulation protein NodH n=1 Tax=Phaeovulum sp. TaxID=2934796 RepID=UPI002730C570|nr:nodulation protein NodH [Phaeovulum sp.]MDP1669029.1 nodulation protein NodH [Phaeovulum sp.]MDZ4117998.1 nodulation protein NodH [Phaeovulum sp.]
MTRPFDTFVIFAEMRTGSNLLEASLNQIEGLTCHGEAFNPAHLGDPKLQELLGVTLAERTADPFGLLARIRGAEGLNGFRYFHDHDPRVLEAVLADPRCAKIILTRNPVESYISLKIAYNTDRWRLTDVRDRREFKAPFKPAEFEAFLAPLLEFQVKLLRTLQTSGQTAFYVDYEDILNVDVLNGMARFLGHPEGVGAVSQALIVQNPEEMAQKVRNFPEMEAALARIDWFNLSRTPNFEPRRGPNVPGFVAASGAPLLYLPLKTGPEARVRGWLAGFDGGLIEDFTQKSLRQWKRGHPGHRSFTVLRHPLSRAHAAFTEAILPGRYGEIREVLRSLYEVPLPPVEAAGKLSALAHRTAFMAFLKFLKANLNGQTSVRIDQLWASQYAVIQGFGSFAPPDMLCREETLAADLGCLAAAVGLPGPALPPAAKAEGIPLAKIYDGEMEAAAREAYPRDYMSFGFSDWRG